MSNDNVIDLNARRKRHNVDRLMAGVLADALEHPTPLFDVAVLSIETEDGTDLVMAEVSYGDGVAEQQLEEMALEMRPLLPHAKSFQIRTIRDVSVVELLRTHDVVQGPVIEGMDRPEGDK